MGNTKIQNKKILRIAIYFGLFGLYLIYYNKVIQSGYYYDDRLNSVSQGIDYMGDSVFALTLRSIAEWISKGRFFPFSSYTYLLFAIIPNRYVYKFLLVTMIYIGAVIWSRLIKNITQSEGMGYLGIVVYLLFSVLNCEYHSAIYGYHYLLQLVWILVASACLLFWKYMETNKKYYMIISVFVYVIAMGTYELSFGFILIMAILAYMKKRSIKNSIKVLIPNLCGWGVMLLINVYLRTHATDAYGGTAFGFDILGIIKTFIIQCSGSFPSVTYANYQENRHFLGFYHFMTYTDIIMAVLITAAIAGCLLYIKNNNEQIKNTIAIVIVGIMIVCIANGIISLSARYQSELKIGIGYLQVYIAGFGFSVLFALLVYYLWKKICGRQLWVKIIGVLILFGMVSMVVIPNQVMARETTNAEDRTYQYGRDVVENALEYGMLDDIQQDMPILLMRNTIYNGIDGEVFYSKYCKQNMSNVVFQSRIISEFGVGEKQNTFEGYYVSDDGDENGGYFFLGKVEKYYTEEGNAMDSVYVDKVRVYLSKSYKDAYQIRYDGGATSRDTSGQVITINQNSDSKNVKLVDKGRDYAVYDITVNGWIRYQTLVMDIDSSK